MTDKKFKAIYGVKDILPDEADGWFKVINTVAATASCYNYGFINPPIFEATELFARGIGDTSDVVTKEMYTFKDKGDRSITLRPEGTASVVRSYLEHSLGAKQGLVKVWYAGPMFRQERPQAGRYRQFYQFGAEAIGSLEPSLDAELITMNFNIVKSLGIEDSKLYINSIGMPSDRESHRKAFTEFVKPNIDKFCADCKDRFRKNPLRMFDCKEESCRSLLADAPTIFDYLSDENRKHFDMVCEYLYHAGIPFEHNKRLVRGLDYYTRTAWEITSDKLGSQDAISGGGRYDLLVEQLGGKPTPGIGFAAGMERILLAMPRSDSDNAEKIFGFFIAVRDPKFKREAFELAMKIRSLGIPADIDYLGRSLKAQMKQADKSGYLYSMILAEDEMARGKAVVRNLTDSRQTEFDINEIMTSSGAKSLKELIRKS